MSKKILLIVDDNQMTRRMLKRTLERKFDEVLVSGTPEEAEHLLTKNPVTHLLCDCNLGPGLPPGCKMIPKWRNMRPSISRAVIFSGSDILDMGVPPEVDCVVSKSDELEMLFEALEDPAL